MTNHGKRPLMQTTRRAKITNASRPEDYGLGIQWVFPLEKSLLIILGHRRLIMGRSEECDFTLSGPEASRHHAEVRREGEIFVLRDLDSTNGVFVNGEKIREIPLSDGAVIRLAERVGVVLKAPEYASERAMNLRELSPRLWGGHRLAEAIGPARKAARSQLPIVVQGETGTGKECVARAIHEWSNRKGVFLAVNCAALPESLAEAELFGYRKGAFTGADQASLGYFRSAHEGTLLLDEITDLPFSLQAKLLRVLEQREVFPLGETKPVAVDVRCIVAAQESIKEAVSEKRFRADLYARLDGLTVKLPPLRDRIEDVAGLFARFLQEHSGGLEPEIEPKLVERLLLYDWPFNVRELDFLARRLLVLYGHEPALLHSHLPERVIKARCADKGQTDSISVLTHTATNALKENLSLQERNDRDLAALLEALREHRGNVARAAAAIDISRQRAYRLMDGRPEFDLEAFRQPSSASKREKKS